MKRLILFLILNVYAFSFTAAQEWTPKDIGVGIFDDSEYDRVLKIVERKDEWVQAELYESGAFAGRGKTFGAWIAGPPVESYLNSNGVPIYLYKYKVTYPDGSTQEFGPSGFYTPGFSAFSINASFPKAIGKWKIDFYIWNRENNESKLIGSKEFVMLDKKPGTGWSLKDMGAGIYDDSEYDTVLKIVKRGTVFSQSELYNNGAFAGRGKTFGAWISGPPASEYLNSNGVPIYLYKYKITYPDGRTQEFGPSGFYNPGFSIFSINASAPDALGTWSIDFYIMNRETNEIKKVGSQKFTMEK